MNIISKVIGWFKKTVTWVDWATAQYKKAKALFPGLFEYIEYLYDVFRPRIEDPADPLTPDAAREELINTVATKFTNSPLSIPRSVIRQLLEVVHQYKKLPAIRQYDRPAQREKAERVLRGLRNKYGNR